MLRVGEENARLNCRGEENSRAKWSKVEATWRTVVLGPRRGISQDLSTENHPGFIFRYSMRRSEIIR
jgi:hypothetical protein